MLKTLIVILLLSLNVRLYLFDFNPQLPKKLIISSFEKHSNNFYTASAENFNISFSLSKNLQVQDQITYTSYEYNEKYRSYNLTNVEITNSEPTGYSKIQKNLYYFKQKLLKRLNLIFSGKAYELSAGMLFGEKSALSKEFKEKLTTVGLIHIVVVSGFNISLVGLLILNLLKRFGYTAYIISFLGIVLYSVLVGLEPPVLRALIMGSIVLVARIKGEEANQIYLLFTAGFIMLFINPIILTSLSFQLSFMATLGVLTFTPIFDSIFPKYLSDISASISAQIMVLPIIALNFGQISLISPIANLLTLWAVPIITVISGLLLLISFFNIAVAGFFSFLVTIPCLVIEKTANTLSILNFASVTVEIDIKKVVITYLCIFAFYLYYIFYLSRP